ncbi:hypothetical protein FVB9532_03658 [Mesonia oceanica]|uniref:Uncharacterized protein n=2 Tax=Mesonia oceanica TaxID=2687242 RepID=A0AC61YCW9_9FLAO|nr:hypothetical protein FVB9532_03658 [Mesonia oceanica]
MVDANVSCNAGNDGQATASAVGGTSPYTYLWDDADMQTTATATGLAAGTYTVTITDDNGCTDTASVTINEPVTLTASATVDDNVSCNAGNDGTATASGTGGTPPYTYLWDDTDAQTTATAVGLAAGTYTVTITDDNGCTDTASVTITEPIALTASATVDDNVSCNGGGNGNITIELTGGTSPFEYVINGTTYSNFPDPTLAISGLQAGTYPINVTDANGCTATTSVTITEPAALSASAIVDANVNCNGGENGLATVAAVGGTAPYTYLWDDNDAQTTATATGLAAGTYNVTVTDDNGCTDTASVTITEPVTLTASATVDTNVSCNAGNDGTATASGTGGTPPYTYLWDDTDAQTTATATGLTAGTYTVTITDANLCTATASATINEPVTLTASAIVDANASCNAGENGQATVAAVGGTAPYTYLWDDTDAQTTATATGLAAGTYNVTVTDDNGCTDTASVTITEPAALTASAIVDTNVNCNGGTNGQATVAAVGGTAPYTYLWDDNDAQTTATATGLAAGTYTVTITDDNGCTDTASVTITEPVTLTASTTVDANVSCNGESNGQATVSAVGGTAPYTYLWDDNDAQTTATATGLAAGTYNVTITDANLCTTTASATINEPVTLTGAAIVDANVSCNGSANGQATVAAVGGTAPYTYLWDDNDAQTTATAIGLAAGTYNVTITDANGCTATASATITEPTAIVIDAIVTANASCNGANNGAASITITGGAAPYEFDFDNSTYADVTDNETVAIGGLLAGTYEVTVTDANNCPAIASVTITEPTTLLAEASVDTDLSCIDATDGSATVTVAGGVAPYTYLWDDADAQTTATATGLVAGTYTVTVTDDNGCTTTASVDIVVADDEAPVVVCQDITVSLDENGNASILAEDIDNGSTDNCTIASFEVDIDTFDCTMIGMNNVTLTVTDESGNSATCSSVVTVEDNEMPMVSCQALFINLDENGQASIVPEDIVTASSDNCAVETLSLDIDTFSCEDAGTEVEVTVFAQDASGNIASCSALVSVNDVTAPVIECMEEMEVVGNTGDNFYSLANFVANGDVTATDSCDGEVTTIVQTPPAGTLLQEGQHEILFVAEDQYGNSSICSTIITVTLDLKVDAPRLNLGKVKLYPNPADSYITVENPQSIALDKMVIYDLNGRKVMDMDLVNYSQGQHIDISKLEAAQYFAMIRSKANGTVVKRFIKE